MILVRLVFQAKFGRAEELAAAFKSYVEPVAGQRVRMRVLTDLSGPFDTVVQELEFESFEAWQRSSAAMFSDPRAQDLMHRTSELIDSGYKEFYTIEAQT